MNTVMVRYQVKPDRVEENRAYIAPVFDALNATRPAGLRYASFQMPDGVSFVHMVTVSTDDGESPLAKLQPFKDFVADIGARCDVPPEITELSLVGNYKLVGA